MLKVKLEGVDEFIKQISPTLFNKTAGRAVSDAAKAAKSETSRLIRERWNIKKRDLDRKFSVRPSSRTARTLTIAGRPIGLAYFGARQVSLSRSGVTTRSRGKDGALISRRSKRSRKQVGLSVEIHKGRRTTLTRGFLVNARNFAGRSLGGELLFSEKRSARVLERFGGKLVAPRSISVPAMFSQANVEPAVLSRTQDVLRDRFLHHLKQIAGGR